MKAAVAAALGASSILILAARRSNPFRNLTGRG